MDRQPTRSVTTTYEARKQRQRRPGANARRNNHRPATRRHSTPTNQATTRHRLSDIRRRYVIRKQIIAHRRIGPVDIPNHQFNPTNQIPWVQRPDQRKILVIRQIDEKILKQAIKNGHKPPKKKGPPRLGEPWQARNVNQTKP